MKKWQLKLWSKLTWKLNKYASKAPLSRVVRPYNYMAIITCIGKSKIWSGVFDIHGDYTYALPSKHIKNYHNRVNTPSKLLRILMTYRRYYRKHDKAKHFKNIP